MFGTTLAVLAALSAQASTGQAPSRPPAPEPLTFASDVRMIRLDVSVVDGLGRPVRGLMAEHFRILENGKPVDLSVFEAIEDGSLATTTTAGDSKASIAVHAGVQPSRSPNQRIVIVTDPSALDRKSVV